MVPQILQALPGPAGYQEAADGQSGAEKAQEDHPPLKGRHLAEVGKDAVSQQHRHDARKEQAHQEMSIRFMGASSFDLVGPL